MSFGLFLKQVRSGVSEALSGAGYDADFGVDAARPGFGDAACNAPFLLARGGRSPSDIAQELASLYRPEGLVLWCKAHPSGYLNFGADDAALASESVRAALDGTFGIERVAPTPTVVEHTSVNPNKALHIGHVRNVVVGDCVSRVLARAGRRVSVLNYVDDSGLQVADVVIGMQKLGMARDPPGDVPYDKYCGDEVYVKTTAAYDEDPSLKEERGRVHGRQRQVHQVCPAALRRHGCEHRRAVIHVAASGHQYLSVVSLARAVGALGQKLQAQRPGAYSRAR